MRTSLAVALAIALGSFSLELYASDRLELKAPSHWVDWTRISDVPGNQFHYAEYVPANRKPGSLRDLISITITWGGSQAGAPLRMTGAWAKHLLTTCPGLSIGPPDPRTAGLFAVAYAQFYCPKRSDNGQGSVDYAKVMSTDNSAYMVVVSQRTSSYRSDVPGMVQYENNDETDAFVEWLKVTNAYLRTSVRVCRATTASEECSP